MKAGLILVTRKFVIVFSFPVSRFVDYQQIKYTAVGIFSQAKFTVDGTFLLNDNWVMKLFTTKQAAEKLGVSERRVRALITEGKLKAHQLGREYAIEESAIEDVKTYGKAGRPPKAKKSE
jgi:excisionase family DNA binding protein